MYAHSISQQVIDGIASLKRRGMTDRGIAKATGLSHVTILRWESGEVSPNTRNAEKFLAHLPALMQEHAGAPSEALLDVTAYADTLLNVMNILKRNDSHSYTLLQTIHSLSHAE